jgi:hypothetical protein
LIPAVPWHTEKRFVIHPIVVYQDDLVSASDLRLLKCHFGGHILKQNGIGNTRCFHPDDNDRRSVLHLLDPTFDFSKSVFMYPLLLGIWLCVPGIHEEHIQACNARRG